MALPFGSGDCPATASVQQAEEFARRKRSNPIRRAVAIRALGWRLRVLVGLAIRFGPTLP
jgi:hypothetical protein